MEFAYRSAASKYAEARTSLRLSTRSSNGHSYSVKQTHSTKQGEEAASDRPLDWAATQNNLGIALAGLGERESGTEKLEEAVSSFREALKERTRARVLPQWATTQSNLGNALRNLGERESGTERLEEAVLAFREALKVLFRLDLQVILVDA